MTTIKLCGGLGNQCFQFALGLALEARGRSVQYDISSFDGDPGRRYLLDDFGLNLPTVKSNLPVTIQEKSLLYDPSVLQAKADDVLCGYWQNAKYFGHLRNYIRGVLFDKMKMHPLTKATALRIAELGRASCFVHIRRSDNLRPISTLYHGLTDGGPYYERAIAIVKREVPAAQFLVFSDDPAWAKQHCKGEGVTVVSHNAPSFTERSDHNLDKNDLGREVEDLYLMSLCRHAICANSTFSWWGAWLGRGGSLHGEILNDRVITAPDPWYATSEAGPTDIIPDGWIKVPVK